MAEVGREEYEEHKNACGRSFDKIMIAIKGNSAAIVTNRSEVCSKIDTLIDRLYRDNGHRSIQTILNEHDGFIKTLQHTLWLIIGAIICIAVPGLFVVLWKLNAIAMHMPK